MEWKLLLKSLGRRLVDNYRYNPVADYLDNRILLYESDNSMEGYQITARVLKTLY